MATRKPPPQSTVGFMVDDVGPYSIEQMAVDNDDDVLEVLCKLRPGRSYTFNGGAGAEVVVTAVLVNPVDDLEVPTTTAAARGTTSVQTLIFDGNAFTTVRARSWARKHGFDDKKADASSGNIHVRQASPSMFDKATFRTIDMTDGVQAVIGVQRER